MQKRAPFNSNFSVILKEKTVSHSSLMQLLPQEVLRKNYYLIFII